MKASFSLPEDRCFLPLQVVETEGVVLGAENICTANPSSARLEYREQQPSVLLDLGPLSPGGYPVFRVKAFSPGARLRVCYYDWLETARGEPARYYGDFLRGSCKYLGVELPVLPANPNRYECYTIWRSGEYLYPLIQGQQRFVRILLENPGTFVELESFYIHYTSDTSSYDGDFACADERLTKLWYASAYTAKLATIRSHQWEALHGKLFLRSLTQSEDLGYLKDTEWRDFTMQFRCQISLSPDYVSGISWAIGIKDQSALVLSLTLDGRFHILAYRDGGYRELLPVVQAEQTIKDNQSYTLTTVCKGKHITVSLDGSLLFEGDLPYELCGKIGFCQQSEQVAILESLLLTDDAGNTRSWDEFEDPLSEWEFAHSPWFTADGAKRDRLPWSGDLVWAGPNIYYAGRETKGMQGALSLLAFHQNPQGYVYGTCYPENRKKPASKQWGYYESDLFSMWHVIALAQYLQFTGDIAFLDPYYDCVQKNLEYLWRYVDDEGLFYQRYETSKGLWDHELGDKGTHAYHNLLLIWTFSCGAAIAEQMDDPAAEARYLARAEKIRKAVNQHLWNEELGGFQKGVNDPGFCFLGNSLAMAFGFPTNEQAARIAPQLIDITSHGKIVALAIAGLYRYGYPKLATRLMTGVNPLPEDPWGPNCCISWLGILEDDTAPHTMTECMIYPLLSKGDGVNWGDMSHPDTGLAGILSGYLLGILPTKPGFREYTIAPADWRLGSASGSVPIGDRESIRLAWSVADDRIEMTLENPEGCKAAVVMPQSEEIFINGQQASQPLYIAETGKYQIQAIGCHFDSIC